MVQTTDYSYYAAFTDAGFGPLVQNCKRRWESFGIDYPNWYDGVSFIDGIFYLIIEDFFSRARDGGPKYHRQPIS